jgi:L-asparaginase / beta-aspartyl-peptidase
MPIAITVHGGASTVPPEKAEAYQDGCLRALAAGWTILEQGGEALDAVEAAIRVLEDDKTFNAGHGGSLDAEGAVSADAAIMRGSDLRLGALGTARGLRHPISVARQILEKGPLLLVGQGAEEFAAAYGCELVDPEELVTAEARQAWEQELQQHEVNSNDTVGCVALDQHGCLATGTSTGGEILAPAGRVGDSALAGCGFYADNARGACAVSGTGEAIMQVGVARTVLELLATGSDPDAAAEQAIAELGERVQGEGGCIVVAPDGRIGWAHNSPEMTCAYRHEEMAEPVVHLRKQR